MSFMRVYYYENELEDEFSSASIKAKKIDADYDYNMDSAGRRFLHFFWYKIIAKPIARLFLQLKCPVMCFTNTYQKRKHGQKPRIVTYIDGPFRCDRL